MKNIINLVYLKDIGFYLDGENIKYYVEFDGQNYKIRELPTTYSGHLSMIYDKLCYDYDDFNIKNKNRYTYYLKSMKKIDNNIYQIQTKRYVKKL